MSDEVGEKLSVVVLNHNGGATLHACLDSLRAKTHYRDWELVVVDTGSTDGSLEPIRGQRDVRIIEERERHVARAFNRAFATCGDSDVVRVDCRVVVQTDGWLEQLVSPWSASIST